MPRQGTTKLPKFKSEAEEAAWWDRNPDFIAEQFEKGAKRGKLLRSVPKSQSITIRIASQDVARARELAEAKGLPYQTYIKMLLHQALAKERRAG